MWVTRREMEEAYYEGTDVLALYRRRHWFAAITATAIVLPILLVGLYVVKSALGIDLFEFHLTDVF